MIKGLIKWKWDNYAAKRFYLSLALEVVFLIIWTCILLITPFPIRYKYIFPTDIWRCIFWVVSMGFLIYGIIGELFDMSYARKRYEDYLVWETERKQNRLHLISNNKYKSNPITTNKTENANSLIEHNVIDETTANINIPGVRSHHSQHHPLPQANPQIIKGKVTETQPVSLEPIDAPKLSTATETKPTKNSSRFVRFCQRFRQRARSSFRSYYMYYSLNNLFDWIVYILCLITFITHIVDVCSHTVTHARIHMYIASVTVICLWFRFMVFFRTISISVKTLRAKLVEIKLGELVIMVSLF